MMTARAGLGGCRVMADFGLLPSRRIEYLGLSLGPSEQKEAEQKQVAEKETTHCQRVVFALCNRETHTTLLSTYNSTPRIIPAEFWLL